MKARRGKTRILYTIPNFDTAGSGLLLYELATHLNKEKFEPHIACLHDRGRFFETVQASGIPVHVFPFTCDVSDRLSLPYNVYKISTQLRQIAPDLIHSFHYNADYSEPLAARLAGIKWVYTKKNMGWHGASHNSWVLRSRFASGIIAQNKQMLKNFFPDWGKVKHIPSWVDPEKFAPAVADSNLLGTWGVSPDERSLICVANLVPVKGVEVLIKAFKIVASQFPNWKLWIVGDKENDYGIRLVQLVSEINLQGRIIFTGKVSNVKQFLDQAEVFILPTLDEGRREGSPVALLEAMANAKVALASRVPGIDDQLEGWEHLLFEAGNVEELSKKLQFYMAQSSVENRQLGDKLKRHVSENFEIGSLVKKHEDFYLKLLKLPAQKE